MPTSGNVLATPLIDPELISGVSFSMAKAPWIISSSLRVKFQTITGVRSAAGHWNSDRETMLTGLRKNRDGKGQKSNPRKLKNRNTKLRRMNQMLNCALNNTAAANTFSISPS